MTPCWNGEAVRVAFALDTCDREAISRSGPTGGISGEMIRKLMLQAPEKRCGTPHTRQSLQWIPDNGSAYRAHDTIDFAVGLGLVPFFTPARSPQSNGVAEAFVKTFKRDYGYGHDRPGCSDRALQATSMVRGLQRDPSPQSPAPEVTP
jgi:putative transposase